MVDKDVMHMRFGEIHKIKRRGGIGNFQNHLIKHADLLRCLDSNPSGKSSASSACLVHDCDHGERRYASLARQYFKWINTKI